MGVVPSAHDALAELTQRQRDLVTDVYERNQRAHGDGFLALLLTGSCGRLVATEHSDLDLLVVLADDAAAGRRTTRTDEVDEIPVPWSELTTVEPYGTEGWFGRWAFAWTPVLIDLTRGQVPDLAAAQARVDLAEAEAIVFDHDRLDGWVNYAYRSLKSARDGRDLERRLDAVESLPWFLDVVFTLSGRVRPYNKYLAWELTHHPLPEWDGIDLLGLVRGTLDGDPDAVRRSFAHVRRLCASYDELAGHTRATDTISGWGPELAIFAPG